MQYNPEEYNEILNIFKNESDEIIQELNNGFLKLEKNPENKEPLKRLMQLSHSLKGAAKMIGFNSVQDLAHKIEDIIIYWNNENVKINVNFFQVVYDVCDFLYEIINKSVEEKIDVYDSKVVEFLNKLNNLLIYNKMVPVDNPINKKKNRINNIDINAILLELMFVLEKESDDVENNNEIIVVVLENLTKLSEIFVNTEHEKIIEEISEIITNINNGKNFYDIEDLKQKVSKLRNEIYTTLKEWKFNSIIARQELDEEKPEIESKPAQNEELDEKYNNIFSNLQNIKYEKDFIPDVNNVLREIQLNIKNEKVSNVIDKTIKILDIYSKQSVILDNDFFMPILQSIYLAKKAYSENTDNQINNINFLIQRLTLVEEMLNSLNEEPKNEIMVKHEQSIVSKKNYNEFNNNITPFDFQEIKTLRVDISKLDTLIAQTGELLVNGIKTHEHISDLSKISLNLLKWSSESKKILNYIKYYEKRGLHNSYNNDITGMFFKKIQSFFTENVEIINDLNNDFNTLYNMIFEDDNKLNQTVVEIESIAKGIRVLPLAAIFHSFPRMIRDIAKECGKKVDFYITGSDTTVDKKIIEEIKMPLIHILRNAVSHGIELPEDRIKNNKDETGIIRLSAKQIENNIIITIEDDGYGINIEKIKEIAIQKGILLQEEINNMSNEQIMKLIFLPGFSTKETITDISGRGVGLDVVKTKIANLDGDIKVDSVLNKGCKVMIKVPLAMSSIRVFIIMINTQKYTIPINTIKFVKQIKSDEIFEKDGQNCILYDGHSIPVHRLTDIFGESKAQNISTSELTVIIMEAQGIQSAFIVDKLLGSQEVFLKKLIPPIIKIKNISGFTTLSTGETALIINPYELMKYAVSDKHISGSIIKQLM